MMLRDYQEEICSRVGEALCKHRSVMIQMPTGTGKTVVLTELVRRYLRHGHGCSVLIVAHRIELIEQTGEHLKRCGMDYGVITGGRKDKAMKPVMVASIQTLAKGIGLSPSFVIIDEAHHAAAKTYRSLWNAWPEARFLGLTATPYRMNGDGFTDLFDVLVDSWSVKRFIAEGWLSAFDYYSIRHDSDEQKLIDTLKKRGADGDFQLKELHETLDVVPCIERLFESFDRLASEKKGIIYAIDIAHAEHIAGYYREQGVNAMALSSKTPQAERKMVVEAFRTSEALTHPLLLKDKPIQVLVSVDLFSEGFDCPDVEFIQLARPTLSLAKYLQMVGRGLRPNKGKDCCIIIDNVGLYKTFGLPSGERDWGYYFLGRNLNDGLFLDLDMNVGLGCDRGEQRNDSDQVLVKIVGHEGMTSRFSCLGKAGFKRKRKGKVWVWVDTLTGITFERHPMVVDFKGVEMLTDDGVMFYPRIRSKWVDGMNGVSRKALEAQVGDGFGWMKHYISLGTPDKVYELQEVLDNDMRVYKDETGKLFFQQNLDCPLVSEADAGGKKAFVAWCDAKQREWKETAGKRRQEGFLHADTCSGGWRLPWRASVEKDGEFYHIVPLPQDKEDDDVVDRECWVDWNTGYTYMHKPIVRYRGFVKLVYDGDLVYIMNIHEERFIAYHNWEIRADEGICTIGNKLYLRSDKDGKALRIRKRSGDFQMFVVNEPWKEEDDRKPLSYDAQMMIINKYGKEVELKRCMIG